VVADVARERFRRIAEAKTTLEARARERHVRERAANREKSKQLETCGKRRQVGGKTAPVDDPPAPVPRAKDQVNLMGADSRIVPVAGDGFKQACNAQAAAVPESMLIVSADVSQAPDDKKRMEPVLEKLRALPEEPARAPPCRRMPDTSANGTSMPATRRG